MQAAHISAARFMRWRQTGRGSMRRTGFGKRAIMILVDLTKKLLKRGAESAKFKFNLIISMIAMVHVCLVVLFCALRITPMAILNIGSVLLYLTCLWVIRHDGSLRSVFYATYLEIIVQSFAATVCIGWRFGFLQYVIDRKSTRLNSSHQD